MNGHARCSGSCTRHQTECSVEDHAALRLDLILDLLGSLECITEKKGWDFQGRVLVGWGTHPYSIQYIFITCLLLSRHWRFSKCTRRHQAYILLKTGRQHTSKLRTRYFQKEPKKKLRTMFS